MKKTIVLFIGLVFFSWSKVYTQANNTDPTPPTITAAEYYFDTDPGFGNGISLSITEGVTIDQTANIDVTALSVGTHRLYIRTRDANGKWSTTNNLPFYKASTVVNTDATPPTITAAEYYFDIDPGFGNGTALTITEGVTIDQTTDIDVTALSVGTHRLYVRTRDANGRWSTTNNLPFYKASTVVNTDATPPTITAAEYYFDAEYRAVIQGSFTDYSTNGTITVKALPSATAIK